MARPASIDPAAANGRIHVLHDAVLGLATRTRAEVDLVGRDRDTHQWSPALGERTLPPESGTVGWVVVAGLVHRTLSVPVCLALASGLLGRAAERYVPVILAVVAANLVLTVGVVAGRLQRFIMSRTFFVVDISSAVALEIWATSLLPRQSLLLPQREVFHLYLLGTVVVWTSLRGLRTAAVLVLGGSALEVLLAEANGSGFPISDDLQILTRSGWLAAGLAVPFVVIVLARHAARIADAEGLRAGRALERDKALRSIHDTVLQTFGQIAQRCATADAMGPERFDGIRALAESRSEGVRAALRGDEEHDTANLTDGLTDLVEEFTLLGLTVDLRVDRFPTRPGADVTRAVLGAVREALTNAAKHSGAAAASVRIVRTGTGVRAEIRDAGRGFDPDEHPEGYGITHSIRRRVGDLGGSVDLRSAPGAGTALDIAIPYRQEKAAATDEPARTADEDEQPTDPADLTRRALGWFAIPALAYRVCISPLQAAGAISNLGLRISAGFAVFMALVLLSDVAVLVGVSLGRLRGLLRSNTFLVVDVGVAVILNLWSAAALPPGSILLPGREVFWAYAIGVTAFWIGVRGARTGLLLVAGGGILQFAMTTVNGTTLTPGGWAQLLGQLGLLAMTLVVVLVMTTLARRGARLAVHSGLEAGRAVERARNLRFLYEHALEGLARVVRLCDTPAPDEDRLRAIRGIALEQSDRLRQALKRTRPTPPAGLAVELRRLREEFRRLGLRVELVLAELTVEPPAPVTGALVTAVHAALANVYEHSGQVHVVVRAADSESGVEIVVRDRGHGFHLDASSPTGGVGNHALRRVIDLGGTVRIWSMPERGTRLVLRSPGTSGGDQ